MSFPVASYCQFQLNTTYEHMDNGDVVYTAGSYTTFSTIASDTAMVFNPTNAGVNGFNHGVSIFEIRDTVWLMWSSHAYDEGGAGSVIVYSYSVDSAVTWATPDTLAGPFDDYGRRADVSGTRFPTACGWYTVDDVTYGVIDISDYDFSVVPANVNGVGMLAINMAAAVPGTPKWIYNNSQQGVVPDSISGYPAYEWGTDIAKPLIAQMSIPGRLPLSGNRTNDPILRNIITVSPTVRLTEKNAALLESNKAIKFWRNDKSASVAKYVQLSSDGGVTWTDYSLSPIPDWYTTGSYGSMSDVINVGERVYFFGNFNNGGARSPLCVVRANDGLNYSQGYKVDESTASPTLSGSGKSAGVQYPAACYIGDGKIVVAYSVAKERIKVSKIDLF